MVAGKTRYLFLIFFVLNLSERFTDCYLSEYADPTKNEIDFLFQIFNEFDKIVEAIGSVRDDLYSKIVSVLKHEAPSQGATDTFLQSQLIREIVSLQHKSEVERKLALKNLNPVSYASVWIVQLTAVDYLVAFVKGFEHYSKDQNKPMAYKCWNIIAFLAAFIPYKTLAVAFSNKFVELVEMVDRVQVPKSIRDIASTYKEVTEQTKTIWQDCYTEPDAIITAATFSATNTIVELKSKYDSYFGNMLFGHNTKMSEISEENEIWNMADKLGNFVLRVEPYKLTDLLRKLVLKNVTFDGSNRKRTGLKYGEELQILRVKRDVNGNPAQEMRFAQHKGGVYHYANREEVKADSFDKF